MTDQIIQEASQVGADRIKIVLGTNMIYAGAFSLSDKLVHMREVSDREVETIASDLFGNVANTSLTAGELIGIHPDRTWNVQVNLQMNGLPHYISLHR